MNNISIKTKIISLSTIGLLLLGIIVGIIAIEDAKVSLLEARYNQLEAIKTVKKNQIEHLFKVKKADIEVLANSEDAIHITRDLRGIHKELGVKGDEKFPFTNSKVSKIYSKHENFFQGYINKHGYYDVFVICAKHGHVLYTATKESDIGENLVHGKLKNSGLAKVWKRAAQSDKSAVVDMEPYAPSKDEPAMFIATPIKDNGETIAILALQLSDKFITDIMSERSGLGETGETYLVGEDKLMRSDSYLDPKNHSLRASFANTKSGSVDTEAVREALKGRVETKVIMDYNGNPVLSAYEAINLGAFKWIILAEIDEAEVLQSAILLRNKIIISVAIVFLIVAIGMYIGVNSMIIAPINKLKSTAKDLARGEGNLTQRLLVNGKNELSAVNSEINNFIERIQNTIVEIKLSSNETASVANELSATSKSVGVRVEEEANIVDGTVKGFEGMQTLLIDSLDKSKETTENIINANQNLDNAKSEILTMVSKIHESSEVEAELSAKLNQLSADAEQVKGVLTVISDIADQTNLLALNAAIEAARAGEHGRGFAVVADEVRQLAERTQKSLTEINATINVIVQAILNASGEMNKNADSIQELASISTKVEDEINETSSVMEKTAKIAELSFSDISKVVEEATKNLKELEEVNTLTNSNARSVEEMASATEHLHQMTEELNSKLNEFKT